MKKAPKILAAIVLAVAFGFASCESKTAQNVENAAESAAEEIETTADSALAPTDTITVEDEPVKDGVADKVENQ
ncbi:hypothetical protein EFA69_04395 [Rufibacter immobilis]|uniref:Lipoprotein n=1 Tax=Rufibacter immobilis TaxID=1348778 RepID=A0A3M9N439_9BACT|nr:hypothetical protein [Rufibacter immobilis]RNI32564.1 hypothetical protein EFA69_04395 [Rufibacter immobilis]